VREIRALERRVYGGTKFDRMMRWRIADLLLLVIPRSLLSVAHVPEGWGILVAEDAQLEAAGDWPAELELHRRPAMIGSRPDLRVQLLNRIALSGTRRLNRELGVEFEAVRSDPR
jgi:hypothetical protein